MTFTGPHSHGMIVPLLLCLVLISTPAQAEDLSGRGLQQADPASAGVSAGDEGRDIVLLLDSSESMNRTDPYNYRKNAARLIISLLGKDDRISIMNFGASATRLKPLIPNTGKNHAALFNVIDQISSGELSTNMTDAVKQGFEELMQSRRKNRFLVMLSDGKLALGSRQDDDAAFETLKRLLPGLAGAGIRLFAVALSDEADRGLLEGMAAETKGFFRFAKTDADVHLMFASIFEMIKAPDSTPFEGEKLRIDPMVSEVTVLVTKKAGDPVTLVDPSNRDHTAMRHFRDMAWLESAVFDMITIKAPAAGAWSVKGGAAEANKAYVLTDLSLKTSFGGGFISTEENIEVAAWLERQGSVVTEKAFLENTVLSAELTGPDGKVATLALAGGGPFDRRAGGKYSATLRAIDAGEYTLRLLANGGTFRREILLPFKATGQRAPVAFERAEGPERAPAPPAGPVKDAMSWTAVLLRFAAVNLALIVLGVLAGGGYVAYRKTLARRWKRP